MKPVGTRHKFDPDKHCGGLARTRNPEYIRKGLLRAQHGLAHLRPTTRNYDAKKERYEKIIRISAEKLEELEKNPDARPCCLIKGFATDHKGEGYCFRHCLCHGRRSWHDVTGNLYRAVRHRIFQDAMNAVELQTLDILDLVPEAKALKALVIVFLDEIKSKTLSAHDIETATNLLDKTGRMVERINAIRLKTGLITFEAVDRLTQEMTRLFMGAAKERHGQILDSDQLIQIVKQLWGGIKIDTNTKALPVPVHQRLAQ